MPSTHSRPASTRGAKRPRILDVASRTIPVALDADDLIRLQGFRVGSDSYLALLR